MSMIKPVANQRRSVGMMEIMGSRTGRYAGMAYAHLVVFAWPRPRARHLPCRRWRRPSTCRCSPALAFQPSR